MSACCGPSCSKVAVIFYNLIFWISGISFTVLGGALIYEKSFEYMYTLLNLNPEKFPPELIFYAAYAVIGLGGLILFVGFFGCCGALQNSKCMVGTYIFFLIIICFAEAALALGCVYCHFSFKNSQEIKTGMKENFIRNFTFENNTDPRPTFSDALNYIQFSMKCCGVLQDKDYDELPRRGGMQNMNRPQKSDMFPTTCCVPRDDFLPVDDKWKYPPPKNIQKCQAPPSQYPDDYIPNLPLQQPQEGRYPEGCSKKINEFFILFTIIIAASSGGFAVLQIFGILFSLCFIRNIGEDA